MITILKPAGRKKRIPLTPLIDVIFILVMFFLLSSTFGAWRPLDVSIGEKGQQQASGQQPGQGLPAVLIQLEGSPKTEVMTLRVNGLTIPLEKLSAELDRLAGNGANDAILLPAPGTDFQKVVRVLDMARASKIRKVSLQLN